MSHMAHNWHNLRWRGHLPFCQLLIICKYVMNIIISNMNTINSYDWHTRIAYLFDISHF